MKPDDPTRLGSPPSPPSPPSSSRPQRAPGRRLAITGLVLALVPCCPLTGLTGALLGALALRAMRLAGARPGDTDAAMARSRRIAFAAIGVGAVTALIWSAGLDWLARAQDTARDRAMITQVVTFIDAASAGENAAALEVWSQSDPDRPDVEAVTYFGSAVGERYGELDRFSVISTARSGSLLSPIVEVAGVFHFENESPLGSARFALTPGGLVPRFNLTHLSIEDRARGDLALGPDDDQPEQQN